VREGDIMSGFGDWKSKNQKEKVKVNFLLRSEHTDFYFVFVF